jgi:hypothetical protein
LKSFICLRREFFIFGRDMLDDSAANCCQWNGC